MRNVRCRSVGWRGFLVLVGLLLAVAASARQQPPQCSGPVTEDGVAVLLRGGVAEARISWILSNCGMAFDLVPAVEQRLRREGASDGLLATIRDLGIQRARREADRARQDEAAQWTTARDTGTVAAFEAYLAKYPSGAHAAEAKSRRDALLRPVRTVPAAPAAGPVPPPNPPPVAPGTRRPVPRTIFRALHHHGDRVWDAPPCAGEINIDGGGFVFSSAGHNFRFKRDDIVSITNNNPNPPADGWIRVIVRDGRHTTVLRFAVLTDSGAPLPTTAFLESLEAVRAAAGGK